MNTRSLQKRSTPKVPQSWHLVTNHLNLLYMLAAGLVMEPSGFRGKHYVDSLATYPGWIPLFRNGPPPKALEQAISERKYLRPCLVSLDLSRFSGPVQVLSREGKIRIPDAEFPKVRLGKEGIGILVRAPLPLTLLSRIRFQSEEDRQVFETAANVVSNVDLKPYRLEVEDSLFRNVTNSVWPPSQPAKPGRRSKHQKEPNRQSDDLFEEAERTSQDLPPQIKHRHIPAQALGGLLAMLYHFANRSELGLGVFQLITGSAHKGDEEIQDKVLLELPNWLNGSDFSECSYTPAILYWGAMDALVTTQEENHSSQSVDVVLEYLDAQISQLTDEKYRSRLERLVADMRGCLGLDGGTINELFERTKGSLSRPLLLFCLREHCLDLLKFSHPLLSDAEYLLAGILFGVRDGWLKLPSVMRNPELSAYVMDRMAKDTHIQQGDVLSLRETPDPHPQPLRALFPRETESWHESQTNAAIEIAEGCKWMDCIGTVVTPADGSPLEEPKRENGTFIFCGKTNSTLKVWHDVFLKRLGDWPPIDWRLESKIRNDLEFLKRKDTDLA